MKYRDYIYLNGVSKLILWSNGLTGFEHDIYIIPNDIFEQYRENLESEDVITHNMTIEIIKNNHKKR
jgi:hypothetical protein